MTLPKHQRLPVAGKFGTLHISPLKKQDKQEMSTFVTHIGCDAKLQSLREKMASILTGKAAIPAHPVPVDPLPEAEWEDINMEVDVEESSSSLNVSVPDISLPKNANPRQILFNTADHTVFDHWKKVMLTLVNPLIAYIDSTNGRGLVPKEEIKSPCADESCTCQKSQILCLFLDCKWFLNVHI
jgi:hypothetical protein